MTDLARTVDGILARGRVTDLETPFRYLLEKGDRRAVKPVIGLPGVAHMNHARKAVTEGFAIFDHARQGDAAEADPDGFWEYARQWREQRETVPEVDPTPAVEAHVETSLGVLSTEPF